MGREKDVTGRTGEIEAVGFLRRNGYAIIATNIRTPFGELDIVAKKGGYTVFVEVKTRATPSLGPPCLAVHGKKAHHIIKNALHYLMKQNKVDSFWRIDVVSVTVNSGRRAETIELIENAITADDYYSDMNGIYI